MPEFPYGISKENDKFYLLGKIALTMSGRHVDTI